MVDHGIDLDIFGWASLASFECWVCVVHGQWVLLQRASGFASRCVIGVWRLNLSLECGATCLGSAALSVARRPVATSGPLVHSCFAHPRAMPLSIVKLQPASGARDGLFSKQQNQKLLTKARAEAIAILKHDDGQVFLCLQALRARQFASASAPANNGKDDDTQPWPATYTQHRRVGKAWIAAWVLQQASGISAQALVAIDTADTEDGLRRLLEYGTGIKQGGPFPKPLLSKTICGRFYTARYKDLGKRFEKLVKDGALNLAGVVDYQVFSLLPAKDCFAPWLPNLCRMHVT